MFEKEAEWVREAVSQLPDIGQGPILNLGSSDLTFRTVHQPWIDRLIFAPLREKGVKVVHADLREGEGIDIRADILSQDGFKRLEAVNANAVMCCNLLEHVTDPAALAHACQAVVPSGRYLIVTVPLSYPYHRDPIDTLYRPDISELRRLFSGSELIQSEILEPGSYWDEVKERPLILLRPVFRFPFPFLGFAKWKRSMKKLYWLVRPYKVTCAVFRKR